jgi:hypothetical protein
MLDCQHKRRQSQQNGLLYNHLASVAQKSSNEKASQTLKTLRKSELKELELWMSFISSSVPLKLHQLISAWKSLQLCQCLMELRKLLAKTMSFVVSAAEITFWSKLNGKKLEKHCSTATHPERETHESIWKASWVDFHSPFKWYKLSLRKSSISVSRTIKNSNPFFPFFRYPLNYS